MALKFALKRVQNELISELERSRLHGKPKKLGKIILNGCNFGAERILFKNGELFLSFRKPGTKIYRGKNKPVVFISVFEKQRKLNSAKKEIFFAFPFRKGRPFSKEIS